MLAAVWVFVEILNAGTQNGSRIWLASHFVAIFVWLAGILGGYWYVSFYDHDKTIIQAGPQPWAHYLVMETKEHLAFVLLLTATYLPIVTMCHRRSCDLRIRPLALTITALIVFLILVMDRLGTAVSWAVRMGPIR